MLITNHSDFGAEVIDRLSLEWLQEILTEEEWEILVLKAVEELTFDEIGNIIAAKYRDDRDDLTGSAIRYHYEKIRAKCLEYREYL